jgi:hypothetical protein
MARHHRGKHHGKHHAKGGRTDMVASGNPDVLKEARGEEPYEGKEKGAKRGGRQHHKHHRMTGGAVRPRLDRPGRKRGGRVGSDTSPLTSAHHTSASETEPREEGGN